MTILSRSGGFKLTIDPDFEAITPTAEYTVEDGEDICWHRAKGYSLRWPYVTDEGVVVGFAYEAHDSVPNSRFANGECLDAEDRVLSLVMLDTAGQEIAGYRYRQCVPDAIVNMYPTPLPRPFVMQFLVDANESVAAFQISVWSDGCEQAGNGKIPLSSPRTVWRFYSIRTGKLMATTDEEILLGRASDNCSEETCGVIEAVAIPERPLFLMHALLPDATKIEYGARFVVTSNTGQRIWSLDAFGDYQYMQPPNEANGITPAHLFGDAPAIALKGSAGQFCIRLRREKKELLFNTRKSEMGSWIIEEIGSRPYTP